MNLDDSRVQSSLERTRERQRWVRFVLPHVVTRLSWCGAGQTNSQLVTLVNISAQGVCLLVDAELPPEEPFVISIDDGNGSTGPIPAVLVGNEKTAAGRTLARFRFDSVQSSGKIIPCQQERRAWQRMAPVEEHAALSWSVGDHALSVPAVLKDIGGGGVAAWTEALPPSDQPVWLSVGKESQRTAPVECRVVGCDRGPSGMHVVRLAFVELCPFHIYEAAMGPSG